jgi:prevent-host-death family protein
MTATIKQIPVYQDEGIIRINVNEAQAKLTEILQEVNNEDQRFILTENGQNKAVIISLEAFEFVERMIQKVEDEIDLEAIHKARKQRKNAQEKNISWDELKHELG